MFSHFAQQLINTLTSKCWGGGGVRDESLQVYISHWRGFKYHLQAKHTLGRAPRFGVTADKMCARICLLIYIFFPICITIYRGNWCKTLVNPRLPWQESDQIVQIISDAWLEYLNIQWWCVCICLTITQGSICSCAAAQTCLCRDHVCHRTGSTHYYSEDSAACEKLDMYKLWTGKPERLNRAIHPLSSCLCTEKKYTFKKESK